MIIFQPARNLLLEKVKKYAKYLKGKVLDAGSGPVLRYRKYIDCEQYLTLDFEEKNKPQIIASMDSIPLEDTSLDSILCMQALTDLKDMDKVAKEFNRILKSGGHLMLSDDFMSFLHDEPHDFWRITKFGLKEIFENNGFQIIEMEQKGGFWAVIAQFKIRYMINRFNLYKHKLLLFLFAPPIRIYAWVMLWLDKKDKSEIKNKFTLGWFMIAKKIN